MDWMSFMYGFAAGAMIGAVVLVITDMMQIKSTPQSSPTPSADSTKSTPAPHVRPGANDDKQPPVGRPPVKTPWGTF